VSKLQLRNLRESTKRYPSISNAKYFSMFVAITKHTSEESGDMSFEFYVRIISFQITEDDEDCVVPIILSCPFLSANPFGVAMYDDPPIGSYSAMYMVMLSMSSMVQPDPSLVKLSVSASILETTTSSLCSIISVEL
jgi:hypothetical protein